MAESTINKDLRLALTTMLDRVETRLIEIARVAPVNALLSMADPALVLPSPAVALMAFHCNRTSCAGQEIRLRARESFGPVGDSIFSTMDAEFTAHPWYVKSSAWIERTIDLHPAGRKSPGQIIDGIRVELVREQESTARAGSLSLQIDGGRITDGLLPRAVAVWKDQTLESHAGKPLAATGADNWEFDRPLNHHLAALTSTLFHVEIPLEACRECELVIELRFEDGMPVAALPPRPQATANAAIVWNSVTHYYPEFSAVSQATSEVPNKVLHPLTTFDLGEEWSPYSLTSVQGSKDWQTGGSLPAMDFREARTWDDYALILVPGGKTAAHLAGFHMAGMGSNAQLALMLSPEFRRRLDRERRTLSVGFRATTGGLANAIPAGTEFEVFCSDGFFPTKDPMSGRLITPTWGGTDGITTLMGEQISTEQVRAFLPSGRARSIGDVLSVIQLHFSGAIKIYDERDLLRRDAVGVDDTLYVRVRIDLPNAKPDCTRAMLQSCESFIASYIRGNNYGHIRLVPINTGEST